MWSPLAGSDPRWQDAADRARRAAIRATVWLAVTAAAAAVTVALYAWDLSKPQADFTLAVVAPTATGISLLYATIAWGRRNYLKKIDRARRADDGTELLRCEVLRRVVRGFAGSWLSKRLGSPSKSYGPG